ncbi:MAG: glycoside hydrolase family 3 C-terminal domain-containing protein [Clostridia bacterium]|nr:glycoside hydrolase family 3 C-terminal domain-containing protein [Clostridia bacterium]
MRNLNEIISQLTLDEKASLCSGFDFWHTQAIERLGIPSIMMSDGPHGLRKQGGNTEDMLFHNIVPATCFPSAAGLACSWDRKLLEKVGIALGEESQAEGVSILLGPGANIKRSPLCGRNFEYFSEDPYLSSEMAGSHIKGVQSQGVGTSLKHFAVNNQEHRRMSVDAVVDERTLREIYLASFESAVKQSQPWTVMCSYNKVNGEYASQNKRLLTDILKEEWGFEGFVVSDWGAVDERDAGVTAGLDLEMPTSSGVGAKRIVDAVKAGRLAEEDLNRAVKRLLTIIFKAVENKKRNASFDKEIHHQIAREVARESMVLLKNKDAILPLKKEGTIAVIGAFAKNPRYQGGGSSHVNPTKIDETFAEIGKAAGGLAQILYAEGYNTESDDIDVKLIEEAKNAAAKSDVAVIFAGLPDRYESEGYDRSHIRIPENHKKLIEEVSEVQKNIVVVLSNGSPIEMPWLDKVKGVLEGYLGGQAVGGAIADLLFGAANPCGKLAETFPAKLAHNPSHLNFPGEGDRVEYREGIFIGYRYYDAKDIEPLFPFGFGLSYTNFEYKGITVDKKELSDQDTVKVSVTIKNTGTVFGKEIVQLYVKDVESSVIRPEKELKGFDKVGLEPGEEKTVTFELGKRAFAYYNVDLKDWTVESGAFDILVGKSSKDIQLKETVIVKSTTVLKKVFTRNSNVGDLMCDAESKTVFEQMMKKLNEQGGSVFSLGETPEIAMSVMKYLPLRDLVVFSNGAFSVEMLEEMLQKLNQ